MYLEAPVETEGKILRACNKLGLGKTIYFVLSSLLQFFSSAIGTKISALSHFWCKMLAVGSWWTREREEEERMT